MNAVAKIDNQNKAVSTQAPPELKGLVASDVIIPQVLLMQGMSEFVGQGKAKVGDIIKSTTLEVLGDQKTRLEFIPLALPTPTWIIEVKAPKAQRFEFRSTEARHGGNEVRDWDFPADADGNEVTEGSREHTHQGRRVKCLSLYAILPRDIDAYEAEKKKVEAGEAPDLSKALTPVLIRFRATGFNAGKEVVTLFTQAADFGQKAYKYVIQLGCRPESNDQGDFFVFEVDRKGAKSVKPEHLPSVEKWVNIVSSTTLKVDESGQNEASAPQGPPAGGEKKMF